MGEQRVSHLKEEKAMRHFTQQLFRDIEALEYMIDNNWFEEGIVRIGAEQEMCLVDSKHYRPATIAMEALDKMQDYEWVETELARFNLETGLEPREFVENALSQMNSENIEKLEKIRSTLNQMDADILLAGIMPTLHKLDLHMDNLTPKPRYYALMEAINSQLIGNHYELRMMGIDEILVKHNTPLLEACNTSFQVHLQVHPSEFVKMYNISQALAGPTMAIGANSPIVFGKRLWHESRIALFQQALDIRTTHDHMRERSPRVQFGKGWLKNSILDIYKEDIVRFRPLLASDIEEDSLSMISEGKVPKLRALQVHNSTVYRWNRPCYGISPNGQPHLRIENRVLPAGPTPDDEMANAALWLGAMIGLGNEVDDVTQHISWEDVRDNFAKSAKYSIDSTFTWFNDEKINACDLILKHILPLAKAGLKSRGIVQKDIDYFMGIIEDRAKAHMNGARWQLRAFTKLRNEMNKDEALSVLTASIIKNQKSGLLGHQWPMPEAKDLPSYNPSNIRVDELMQTDLFTVQQDDSLDFIAHLMDWEHLRHLPVEDQKGNLIGLITVSKILKRLVNKKMYNELTAKDLMISKPTTIAPEASILEAMAIMRDQRIGCLPVVQGKELIGLVTERHFVAITSRLLERNL